MPSRPGRSSTSAGRAGSSVDPRSVAGLLDVLRAAERLKDTVRSGYTSGGRQESVADHTWRLCLMALLVHDRVPGVDVGRLVQICVVHDLGEALSGDVPAPVQDGAVGVHFIHKAIESGKKGEWVDVSYTPPGA